MKVKSIHLIYLKKNEKKYKFLFDKVGIVVIRVKITSRWFFHRGSHNPPPCHRDASLRSLIVVFFISHISSRPLKRIAKKDEVGSKVFVDFLGFSPTSSLIRKDDKWIRVNGNQ